MGTKRVVTRAAKHKGWARRIRGVQRGYSLLLSDVPAERKEAVITALVRICGAKGNQRIPRIEAQKVIESGTILWDAPIANVRIMERALRKAGAEATSIRPTEKPSFGPDPLLRDLASVAQVHLRNAFENAARSVARLRPACQFADFIRLYDLAMRSQLDVQTQLEAAKSEGGEQS